MLVFALIMTGLSNLFVATKQLGLHARSRIVASELGRYFLDRLQMQVREDTWGEPPNNPSPNNLLTIGKYKSTNNPFPTTYPDAEYTTVDASEDAGFEEITLDGITYYPVYEVSDKDGVRKVKIIITWERFSP